MLRAADGKITFLLGDYVTLELGLKLFELAGTTDLQEEAQVGTLYKAYGKGQLLLKGQQLLFGAAPAGFLDVYEVKVELELSIASTVALKAAAPLTQQLEKKFSKLYQAQERIVLEQQVDYNKRQLAYNDAVDHKQRIEALNRESRQLKA